MEVIQAATEKADSERKAAETAAATATVKAESAAAQIQTLQDVIKRFDGISSRTG